MNEQARNILIPVLVGGILFIIGQYIASDPARQQQVVDSGREITVTGEGEVSVPPDVAKVTLGTQTDSLATAEAALSSLTKSFTSVLDAVEKIGIAQEDVKTTNFSLYPSYDYIEGRQIPRGFIASQHVVVTVRDLAKVGEVLSVATSTGANQIGGVQFTVDDEEAVRAQAEEEAIAQAREKGERIAKALEATLGDVKTYQVSPTGGSPIAFREAGFGGATEDAVPPVPAGTSDVGVTVTVTFQLK